MRGRHRVATELVRKSRNVSRTRVATLNVGTLTGRSCELVEALERRRVDFCAVQETRTTCGVGVIVSERFRDSIVSVERFDDRLMKIVVAAKERLYHFFSAYAPQTGCSEQTKDEFWSLLDETTAEVPSKDVIIVAGDLNGHVGATKDGHSCHGGFGYGSRNADGERILDYAESHKLTIVNTVFQKRDSHLISYYSGGTKTQIDFILVKDRDRGLVTDAKIVPYETIAPQHRPLICTLKIASPRQKQKTTDAIRQAAQLELGITKPGRRKVDKQAWLWTNDLKAKVGEKKSLYHVFLGEKTADNWRKYQEAGKAAKKAVAVAKATHYGDLNEKLESRDGEQYLYRLAKNRHRQTEDIAKDCPQSRVFLGWGPILKQDVACFFFVFGVGGTAA
ncbi:unnamed protein product [Heligmosomoides polygyrus]|uniref:Endo/exonuclease/phosphatase domain-containing protein n=1 Tax=Heligmosomoides polygyrus TaxID=6339 RepID=A0A183GAA8_HELPZ|nr:unnamed protein product [Heligmosomoides polygyrus]